MPASARLACFPTLPPAPFSCSAKAWVDLPARSALALNWPWEPANALLIQCFDLAISAPHLFFPYHLSERDGLPSFTCSGRFLIPPFGVAAMKSRAAFPVEPLVSWLAKAHRAWDLEVIGI